MSQVTASRRGRYSENGPRLTATARMAYWSARHRWKVVVLSVAAFALALFALVSLGTEIRDGGGVGESAP